MPNIDVKRLRTTTADSKSVKIDLSDTQLGEDYDWDIPLHGNAYDDEEYIDLAIKMIAERHNVPLNDAYIDEVDIDDEIDEILYNEYYPVSRHFWPLENFDEKTPVTKMLTALEKAGPVTIVNIHHNHTGGYFIGLTGGGMDLSWELVAAHVYLGYLPPLELCRDLPDMGKNYRKDSDDLVAACKETIYTMEKQLNLAKDKLNHLHTEW